MLTKEQCLVLLKDGTIDTISQIFYRYHFNDIRLVKGQFSEQYEEINFLVKDNENTEESSFLEVKNKIEKILNNVKITISVELEIISDSPPLMENKFLAFSEENVKQFYLILSLKEELKKINLQLNEERIKEKFNFSIENPDAFIARVQQLVYLVLQTEGNYLIKKTAHRLLCEIEQPYILSLLADDKIIFEKLINFNNLYEKQYLCLQAALVGAIEIAESLFDDEKCHPQKNICILPYAMCSGNAQWVKSLVKKWKIDILNANYCFEFYLEKLNNISFIKLYAVAIIQNTLFSDEEKIEKLSSYLKMGKDWLYLEGSQKSLLRKTCKNGGITLVQWLLNIKPELLYHLSRYKRNVLFQAIYHGNDLLYHYFKTIAPELLKGETYRGGNLLHAAARGKSLSLMEEIFNEYGENLSQKDKLGWLPLHYAALRGSPENILFLSKWDKNFDVNIKTEYESLTPVYMAVNAKGTRNLICLKSLGANFNLPNTHKGYPIHYAAHAGKVESLLWLIENGALLDQKTNDRSKKKVSHIAALADELPVLKILGTLGVNFYETDASGLYPWHYAAINGSIAIIKWFIERDEQILYHFTQHTEKLSIIDIAAEYRHFHLLKWLVENKKITLSTSLKPSYPIHHTARSIYSFLSKVLKKNLGKKINKEKTGDSLRIKLTDALSGAYNSLYFTFINEQFWISLSDIVEKHIIDYSFEEFKNNNSANTATQLVKFYLKTGVWLEQPTDDLNKNLPAHIAAKFDNIEFLEALSKTGVSLHVPNANKIYPIEIAVVNNHKVCTEFLITLTYLSWTIEQARDLLVAAIKYNRWKLFEMLVAYDIQNKNYFCACVNLPTPEGFYPVHYLVFPFGNKERHSHYHKFLYYLIKNKANIHAGDNAGGTILHHMIDAYLKVSISIDNFIEFIDALYKNGFDLQSENVKKETAFHLLWEKAFLRDEKAINALHQLIRAGYVSSADLNESQWTSLKDSSGESLEYKLNFLLEYAPESYCLSLVYPFEEKTNLLSLAINKKDAEKIRILAKWGFFIFRSFNKSQLEALENMNKTSIFYEVPFLAFGSWQEDEGDTIYPLNHSHLGRNQNMINEAFLVDSEKIPLLLLCRYLEIMSAVLLAFVFDVSEDSRNYLLTLFDQFMKIVLTKGAKLEFECIERMQQHWLNTPSSHAVREIFLIKLHAAYIHLYEKVHSRIPSLIELSTYTLLKADEINFSEDTSLQYFKKFLNDASVYRPSLKQSKWGIYRKLSLFAPVSQTSTENIENKDIVPSSNSISL